MGNLGKIELDEMLIEAVKKEDLERVREPLEGGADPNAVDSRGLAASLCGRGWKRKVRAFAFGKAGNPRARRLSAIRCPNDLAARQRVGLTDQFMGL